MNTKKLRYLTLLTLVIVLVGCGLMQEEQSLEPSMVKAPTATTGLAAVAMPDKYAAQISQDILSAGGNAVDAAIAVGFALAVTFIDAGNIGRVQVFKPSWISLRPSPDDISVEPGTANHTTLKQRDT